MLYQVMYKEGQTGASLFSTLTDTPEIQFAREMTESVSEVNQTGEDQSRFTRADEVCDVSVCVCV